MSQMIENENNRVDRISISLVVREGDCVIVKRIDTVARKHINMNMIFIIFNMNINRKSEEVKLLAKETILECLALFLFRYLL